jgi:hypothetical protein
VTTKEAMPLCSVSTDEATKATASTNTGTANQAGASDNKAKKGMGGEPGFLPMAMHSMPKAPMANITGTVSGNSTHTAATVVTAMGTGSTLTALATAASINTIDTLLETAEVTGGPDQATLVGLGLEEDPATVADRDASADAEPEPEPEPDAELEPDAEPEES